MKINGVVLDIISFGWKRSVKNWYRGVTTVTVAARSIVVISFEVSQP